MPVRNNSNTNLVLGHHDIKPIPEIREDIGSIQTDSRQAKYTFEDFAFAKKNEPKMINNCSANSITVFEDNLPTVPSDEQSGSRERKSLKKQKQLGIMASSKEIGVLNNLQFEKGLSVINSVQQNN